MKRYTDTDVDNNKATGIATQMNQKDFLEHVPCTMDAKIVHEVTSSGLRSFLPHTLASAKR